MSRLLLIGLGPTAQSAFEGLTPQFDVAGIIRNKPSGAYEEQSLMEQAAMMGVRLYTDASVAGVELAIHDCRPDCVVVSSYDRILPPRVLNLARFVNVHYSPLPEYRGRANVNWAIINGESRTAITIHVLALGLDSGNILYQEIVPLGPHDTVTDVYAALNAIQQRVLGPTVLRFLAGYGGEPQDELAATYGCARVPGDGEIDWHRPTTDIYALIRALAPPYHGAFTFLEGSQFTVCRAIPVEDGPRYVGRVPGRVVARSTRQGSVDVLTTDGVLRIFEVIADGDAPCPATQYIASTRQTLGLRTSDLLARIQALESLLAQN